MNVFILLAVGIEKIAAKQWISSGTALKLAFLNVAATMFAPCAAVIMWRPIALGSVRFNIRLSRSRFCHDAHDDDDNDD